MSRVIICLAIICLIACDSGSKKEPMQEWSAEQNKMGTVFQITALSEDLDLAKKAVDAAYAEVDRIEMLISSWDADSETSMINNNAGVKPVDVSEELFELIQRSFKISDLTQGIFDISYASMDVLWKFDGSMKEKPSEEAILRSVQRIGYEHISMNSEDHTVFLERTGMKIGFGGIGKGYTANRCKKIMRDMGVDHGLVNAGGDLVTWGNQADGKPWTIGIVNPDLKESALSWLDISDMAVVTSGNYERFVEFDSIRYSHIINPKTGWPAEAIKSVTIICPDAEVADALATAVFIMGVKDGLPFIDQVKDVECLIVDIDGQISHSQNISLNYYEESGK